MKVYILGAAALCLFRIASFSQCDPRPFGCYAYEWENQANADKDIKHAFLSDQWFDNHCNTPACSHHCPPGFVFTTDLEKGFAVNCDITIHFCNHEQADKDNCIQLRIVKVKVESVSDTTVVDAAHYNQVRRTEEQTIIVSPQRFVAVYAMVLPVCLIGESMDACKRLSGKKGEICKENQLNVGTSISITKWCTILEAAFGGEYPESVLQETIHYAKVLNIWKRTGLPYDAITSLNTNFLPGATKAGLTNPLCEVDDRKVTWTGRGYRLEEYGPLECEQPCADYNKNLWLNASDESSLSCRVLDIEGFPLYRRGRIPLAKFMAAKENLDKNLLFPQAASIDNREKDQTFFATYPLPIDYSSIEDEIMRKKVEMNLWLNNKTNPFSKKYGSQIQTLDITYCTKNDSNKICNKVKPIDAKKNVFLTFIMPAICGVFLLGIVGLAAYCSKKKTTKKVVIVKNNEEKGAEEGKEKRETTEDGGKAESTELKLQREEKKPISQRILQVF